MTPESKDYLDKARDDLDDARKIAGLPIPKLAARSAYYAAFHAAEALISERTGRTVKTHSGVISEFTRLTRDVPPADRALFKFLSTAYIFKELSDYGVGVVPDVTISEMETAIETAAHFVRRVKEIMDRDEQAEP